MQNVSFGLVVVAEELLYTTTTNALAGQGMRSLAIGSFFFMVRFPK